MPRMKILNSVEREVFDFPPIFNSVERKRQVSGFGRNQAPKTDRLNQVPSWEFRKRRKSFAPRQLARILWDFAYLCWASTQWDLLEIRDSSGTSRPWFVSSPASGTVSAGALTGENTVANSFWGGDKVGAGGNTLGGAAGIRFGDEVGVSSSPGLLSYKLPGGFDRRPSHESA